MRKGLLLLGLLGGMVAAAQTTSLDTALTRAALRAHPYYNVAGSLTRSTLEQPHVAAGKDLLFYVMVALVLFFAVLRQAFPKYMQDLFRLFFRTTLKQRHLSEQLSQTPLPSLLLNIFFFLSVGLYLSLWIDHWGVNPYANFWWLLLYVMSAVALAYLIKFLTLQMTGWAFRAAEAARSYLFTVFTINKMAGIFLLPLIVVMAFSENELFTVMLQLSWVGWGGLLLYRMLLSFRVVRKQVKLGAFHFLLYVAGFEIAPLLVIYKLVLLNFG